MTPPGTTTTSTANDHGHILQGAPGHQEDHTSERSAVTAALTLLVAGAAWVLTGALSIGLTATLTGTTVHPVVAAVQGTAPRLIVVAVVVGAASVLVGRPAPAILLLLVTGTWTFLLGAGAGHDPASPGTQVRIMSTNLLLSNVDADAAGSDIADADADVLVTVETSDAMRDALAARLGDYRQVSTGNGARGAWTTIWVHERIAADARVGEPVKLSRSELPSVYIRVDGTEIRVVGVHLHAPSVTGQVRTWEEELEELAVLASGGKHLVLAGDFNAGHGHPGFRVLLDALDDAASGPFGGEPTWPVRRHASGWQRLLPPLLDIDHILIGGGLVCADNRRVGVAGSDHMGVAADIAVASGNASGTDALPSL